MPEMDGLEALTAVRRLHPRLPVIMFSTLTQRGATATIEALTRGASQFDQYRRHRPADRFSGWDK